MSIPCPPKLVRLVMSLIYQDRSLLEFLLKELKRGFGDLELIGQELSFNHTDYYTKEMGTELFRRFVIFRDLIARERLSSIKLLTNELEKRFSRADGRRRVNIDPGYLTLENLILATGKNYSHRVYLSEGIYADLTLIFQEGNYQPLPWTYPDYRSEEIVTLMNAVRRKYLLQLRETGGKE
ncbi:MAG: DUF4416 family protein [Deltaproteobacteria bacterium]|nr:MAG: DUF4416 family protein [Deltaproteobacteria bacterium]